MTRQSTSVRIVGLFGALALVVAEFTTLFEIVSRDDVVARQAAGPHHGYALLVLGVAAGGLAWLASRPGAVRFYGLLLLVVGAAAVVVIVAIDVSDLGVEGAFGDIARPAESTAGIAFYLESLGAVLTLITGGLALFALRGAPVLNDDARR